MPKWEVTYVHVVERTVSGLVEAKTKKEAIEKAKSGDWIDFDEDSSEEGLEIKDATAVLVD